MSASISSLTITSSRAQLASANPALEGDWMLEVRPDGAPVMGVLEIERFRRRFPEFRPLPAHRLRPAVQEVQRVIDETGMAVDADRKAASRAPRQAITASCSDHWPRARTRLCSPAAGNRPRSQPK